MLWLHFLLVPSAPGQSFRCQKHPVRHQSQAWYLTPFTRSLWTCQLSWVWQSWVYPDYKALYLGIETHFWLDSRTVQTTCSLYRSPSTTLLTVTVTISCSHSLRPAHLGLPVLHTSHILDYPLHFSLWSWTSFWLLPYLESLQGWSISPRLLPLMAQGKCVLHP